MVDIKLALACGEAKFHGNTVTYQNILSPIANILKDYTRIEARFQCN